MLRRPHPGRPATRRPGRAGPAHRPVRPAAPHRTAGPRRGPTYRNPVVPPTPRTPTWWRWAAPTTPSPPGAPAGRSSCSPRATWPAGPPPPGRGRWSTTPVERLRARVGAGGGRGRGRWLMYYATEQSPRRASASPWPSPSPSPGRTSTTRRADGLRGHRPLASVGRGHRVPRCGRATVPGDSGDPRRGPGPGGTRASPRDLTDRPGSGRARPGRPRWRTPTWCGRRAVRPLLLGWPYTGATYATGTPPAPGHSGPAPAGRPGPGWHQRHGGRPRRGVGLHHAAGALVAGLRRHGPRRRRPPALRPGGALAAHRPALPGGRGPRAARPHHRPRAPLRSCPAG